ncbi:potassium channel family protein [Microbacterium sp. JZ31]|uniref:potassium channel family protein n=1 Tax=Microbacterium sp. JZ31 TaxID=1906274 RepID=UPI0019345C91|nr:potassium channel family protein [Microbacterium sp. JZ31]
MTWFWTLCGIALIVGGLTEVFRTLLHPVGRGRLTRWVAQGTWHVCALFGSRGLVLAGPFGVIGVILLWVGMQIVGWAMVYLPHVPDGFSYSPGLRPEDYPDALEAFYFSAVSLSTLGLGDVAGSDPWVRFINPFESVIGFGLLTAAVSWFLELYPGLRRRRAFALRLAVLERAGFGVELPHIDAAVVAGTLHSLVAELAQVRVDLTQSSESYFFSERERESSLPAMMPFALSLARRAGASDHAGVRTAGDALREAIADFTQELRTQFPLKARDMDETLVEYAIRHGQKPPALTG